MTIVDIHSWPCPVDDDKSGVLVLTDQRLHCAPRVPAAAVEELAGAGDDTAIANLLPGKTWSLPASGIHTLRMIPGRSRIEVVATDTKKTAILGDRQEETATRIVKSLAQKLGLDQVRTENAGAMRALANPLLALLFVLVSGLFLVSLTNLPSGDVSSRQSVLVNLPYQAAHRLGPTAIWSYTIGGAAMSLLWLSYRLKRPAAILVATRLEPNHLEENRPSEEELRRSLAGLLEIEPSRLTRETRFREDLRIPPGVLSDVLEELEEDGGIALSGTRIRTFGDLLPPENDSATDAP